jgi:hypothetical protein
MACGPGEEIAGRICRALRAVGDVAFVPHGQGRHHPQSMVLCSSPVWHTGLMGGGRGVWAVGQVGKLYSPVGCRALCAAGGGVLVPHAPASTYMHSSPAWLADLVGKLYSAVGCGWCLPGHHAQGRRHPQPMPLCSSLVWHMGLISGGGVLGCEPG